MSLAAPTPAYLVYTGSEPAIRTAVGDRLQLPFVAQWTIGRATTNDLCVFQQLDNANTRVAVSRTHAVISYGAVADGFFVTDSRTVNGTFINGIRIAADKPVELRDGDVLTLAGNSAISVGESIDKYEADGKKLLTAYQWRFARESAATARDEPAGGEQLHHETTLVVDASPQRDASLAGGPAGSVGAHTTPARESAKAASQPEAADSQEQINAAIAQSLMASPPKPAEELRGPATDSHTHTHTGHPAGSPERKQEQPRRRAVVVDSSPEDVPIRPRVLADAQSPAGSERGADTHPHTHTRSQVHGLGGRDVGGSEPVPGLGLGWRRSSLQRTISGNSQPEGASLLRVSSLTASAALRASGRDADAMDIILPSIRHATVVAEAVPSASATVLNEHDAAPHTDAHTADADAARQALNDMLAAEATQHDFRASQSDYADVMRAVDFGRAAASSEAAVTDHMPHTPAPAPAPAPSPSPAPAPTPTPASAPAPTPAPMPTPTRAPAPAPAPAPTPAPAPGAALTKSSSVETHSQDPYAVRKFFMPQQPNPAQPSTTRTPDRFNSASLQNPLPSAGRTGVSPGVKPVATHPAHSSALVPSSKSQQSASAVGSHGASPSARLAASQLALFSGETLTHLRSPGASAVKAGGTLVSTIAEAPGKRSRPTSPESPAPDLDTFEVDAAQDDDNVASQRKVPRTDPQGLASAAPTSSQTPAAAAATLTLTPLACCLDCSTHTQTIAVNPRVMTCGHTACEACVHIAVRNLCKIGLIRQCLRCNAPFAPSWMALALHGTPEALINSWVQRVTPILSVRSAALNVLFGLPDHTNTPAEPPPAHPMELLMELAAQRIARAASTLLPPAP